MIVPLLESVALRTIKHSLSNQTCIHAGSTGGFTGSHLVQSIHFEVCILERELGGLLEEESCVDNS